MIIRALTPQGDWTFGNGTSNYLTDIPAIGENIKTRILSWLGNCFFDTGAGIDWLNRLSLLNQKELLEVDLRRIIFQSYGVTGIESFSLTSSPITRKFIATYTVSTIFSQNFTATVIQEIGNA